MAKTIRYAVARWKPGGPIEWSLIIERKRRSRGREHLTIRTTGGRSWLPKALEGHAQPFDVAQHVGRELELDPAAVAVVEIVDG